MQGETISKWYRDNFNSVAAEKELRTTRKGTFLVWWSRSRTDLYMSYIDHDNLIRHLPIKQLGRSFFLEGTKFRSLSELVVHHLTMREFSMNPVNIANSNQRKKLEATHIALVDMNHVPGQPDFCVYRGDLLAEVGRIDDRWLLAKHLPSESIAFFDLTQTSILNDMDVAPDALPYFHDCDDQDELLQRLAEGGRGSFLIRPSRQTTGAYALLVNTGEKIDKFLIVEVKGSVRGWLLSGRIFSSISQILHRYSIRAIQAEVHLTHAVLSAPSEDTCTIGCSSTSTSGTSIFPAEGSVAMRQTQEIDHDVEDRIIVASVNALYKIREDKDWRSCTVTLYEHAGSAILRLIESSRCERHALVLHHTELICLHESMLGRDACVFLSPLQNEPGVFLAFEPLHFFYTWFHLLRRFTVQRRSDAITSFSTSMSYYMGTNEGNAVEMSMLCIHVDKFKGTLLKPDAPYRVDISLNGVGVAHTAYQLPTNSTNVVFDTHFLLIVTSWSCNTQFTISPAGKSRPIAVSPLINVPVSSMQSYFTSAPDSSSIERKTSSAQPFTVSFTRQRVIVLSKELYAPLMESLLEDVLVLAEWSSGRLPAVQRNQLCFVMVSLVWPHSLRALIERTLGKSIHGTSGENVLRQDSFASCLITSALRMSGKAFLEGSLVEELSKKESLTEESLVDILSEVARIPAVSLVLACVAATVAAHLPTADKEHVVRRAISATFVLRFANPLIISCLASSGEGSALARGVQTAANSATMHYFVRDPSGEDAASRLFDLFERVRDSAVQTLMVEAYDTAPEQLAIFCHLLALTLDSIPARQHPTPCNVASSSSSSSSTVTTSSGSSVMSSSSLGFGTDSTTVDPPAIVESNIHNSDNSSLSMPFASTTMSRSHPELSARLMRLLELHRN